MVQGILLFNYTKQYNTSESCCVKGQIQTRIGNKISKTNKSALIEYVKRLYKVVISSITRYRVYMKIRLMTKYQI